MRDESSSLLKLTLGGTVAMAVAMGIGRFVYTPILPGMMAGLDMSAANAGLIASANYLGYLVGAILAAGGWGAGRERAVMLVSLLASGLLCLAMALTGSLAVFLSIRFAAGVASAFVMVFISTIVFSHLAAANAFDKQWLHFGGVGLGISVSSLLIGALMLAHGGWRSGWIGAAALSLAGVVVVAMLVRDGPVKTGDAAREPALVWNAALLRIVAAYGVFGFGYIVTATFLVAIVRNSGAPALFEPGVWLATGLAAAPSVWLWNHAVRRLGYTATFVIGCLVEAVGVAASVAVPGLAGPLLGGILLGGTFVAVTAYGLAIGRQLAGPATRRALATMTAAFGAGQIIGPVVAGYAAEATGSYAAPSLAAAAALLAAAALAWPVRHAVR